MRWTKSHSPRQVHRPARTVSGQGQQLGGDGVSKGNPLDAKAWRNEEGYAASLGIHLTSRVTIPLTKLDDIRAAAQAFRDLSERLAETADTQTDVFTRLMTARMHVYQTHRRLKGGALWNGKTR